MTMNDDAFARLVAEEVKNKVSKSQRLVLMEKENWDKWRRALVALTGTLQTQLDNLADDEESDRERYAELGTDGQRLLAMAMSDYNMRRSKIERFKFHVERRLDEVEQMISTGQPPDSDPLKNAILYENAIKKHRELIETYDIEPTPIDLALWDSLEGQWSFNKIKPEDVLSE
jgi:hypothetical protein